MVTSLILAEVDQHRQMKSAFAHLIAADLKTQTEGRKEIKETINLDWVSELLV